MKAIARSYMWWLGIDKDIMNIAKSYLPCLENKSQPAAAPLYPCMDLAYHIMEKNSHRFCRSFPG